MLKKLLSICAMATTVFSVNAYAIDSGEVKAAFPKPSATDEMKPHVGVLAGIGNPEGNFQAGMEYGVDVGYQPYIPFGLGLELSTLTTEFQEGVIEEDLTQTKLLAKGTYNFGGNIPVISDSYFGLGVGPMLENFAGDDELTLGVMPMLGFDIPLQAKAREYLSLGLNARYLISSSGAPDTFSMNGMVKYWF